MQQRIRIGAILLIVGALDLSAVFLLLTFDGFYRDAVLDRYYLPAKHLQANLQRTARDGARLHQAIGIERDVRRAQAILSAEVGKRDAQLAGHEPLLSDNPATLLVAAPGGEVLYHAGASHVGDALPEKLRVVLATPNAPGEAASRIRYVKADGAYVIPLKIFDRGQRWVASVLVVVDSYMIDVRTSKLRDGVLKSMYSVLAASLLAYALLLVFIVLGKRRAVFPDKRFLWFSLVFVALAQVAAAALGGMTYKEPYAKAIEEKLQTLVALAELDTKSALTRRIRLEDLDFRHYPWLELAREFKELGALEIHNAAGKAVVRVDANGTLHLANDRVRPQEVRDSNRQPFTEHLVSSSNIVLQGVPNARVVARISKEGIERQLMELIADSMAAIMVSLLILLEILLIFSRVVQRSLGSRQADRANAWGAMRPAVFLFLFGIDLTMSFVPLHMEILYEPMFGLPKDVVMGLPISVEFLFVGITMIAAGAWMDRRDWRQPFLAGVLLASAGALYSWLAPDALHFILSRAVVGIGYGFTIMASQGFIIAHSDAQNKAQGLAQLFAGLYGGSICGWVAGAMLAERLGFDAVFLSAGVIVALVLCYAAFMLPREPLKGACPERAELKRPVELAHVWKFLANRSMLGLILFSSLPVSIAAIGFLNYFSPVYVHRMGVSQSIIGQVLMLYGLCLVFLGPWVSRSIDTANRKSLAVFAGGLLGSLALLSFNAFEGFLAAAVAVLILGVSHSIVLASQSAYALSLKVTRQLGEGKAMGIFLSSSRIGHVLGPIVFGCVIVATDIEQGVTYLGYAYLAVAVLFWILTRKDRQMLIAGAT